MTPGRPGTFLTAFAVVGTLVAVVGGRPSAPAARDEPGPLNARAQSPTKVLVFVEENKSPRAMQQGMPYLFGLARRYAYSTRWTGVAHPSLPNYLAMTAGSTFGITDDKPPSVNAKKVGAAISVFDQAIRAGKTAKAYMETMRRNCQRSDSRPVPALYAVKHNFWPYFAAGSTRRHCRRYDVPAGTASSGALMRDVATGRLPNVGMVVPNQMNDAHDGSLRRADKWLKARMPRILSSRAFRSGRLVVIVTADESWGSRRNPVLTVVLRRGLSHKVVTRPLNHYSLTRYFAQVLGVRPLRKGASAPNMRTAFGL